MKFTQEDLLNAMGLKVGDMVEVKLEEEGTIIGKIEREVSTNDYRFYSEDYGTSWLVSSIVDSRNEYSVITPPKYTLTETEKHIVLAIYEKFKWIARDESGLLCAFTERPMKREDKVWSNVSNYASLGSFNHHFQFIQWSDEEPVSLGELREIAKGETK